MSRRFQFSLKWMLGLTTLASVVAALVAMDYVTAPVALVAMSAVVGIASGKSSRSVGCGIASAVGTFCILYVGAIAFAMILLGAPGP